MSIEAELRKAIQDSGKTAYRLAKLTGISPQQISRFSKGERSLTFDVAAQLADALGLHLSMTSDKHYMTVLHQLMSAEKELQELKGKQSSR